MAKLKTSLILFLILLSLGFSKTSKADNLPSSIRLAGSDRYETAVEIAKDGWQQSQYVIIVSGENFPDALSATPLAKKYNAPILPVKGSSLSSNILNEISRLGAQNAFIVGGSGAVSLGIEDQLVNLGIVTTRIAGVDRYETSSKVAKLIGTSNGVVLTSGENYPDALSIAPIAGSKQMPILLTKAKILPKSIQDFITSNYISKSYVVGGTGAVSDGVISGLNNFTRLSGSDRYGTNLAVINEFINDLNFSTVTIATGENFPDALSGSAEAANLSSPIILASSRYYAAEDLLQSKLASISQFKIFGGTSILSDFAIQKIISCEPIPTRLVMGYTTYYHNNDTSSYNSMNNNIKYLDEITTATFTTDSLGNITGNIPYIQLQLAKDSNIKALAMVTNSYDKDVARAVLESSSARQTLISNILNQIKANGYDGVNVDFENLYYYDRSYFTTFLSELYTALHSENYLVTAAVPSKTRENVNDNYTGAYDYPSIANYVDQIVIMTYDEHYTTPGPIASIGWVQSVASYASANIPGEKILLGMAAYGYDWSSNGTVAYTEKQMYNLAAKYGASIQWDSISGCSYFKYTDNSGIRHEAWFETSESLSLKLKLVNNSDVAGIAIWSLGSENSDYWTTISNYLSR